MRLYTVFTPEGKQRLTPLSMPVLVRSLAQAKTFAVPGDTVQAWGSAGHPDGTWIVSANGTRKSLTKVGKR